MVTRSASHVLALVTAVSLVVAAPDVEGAEGMFQLYALPAKDLLRSGLKIPVARLLTLRRAIVQVAHGGSGSFVSREGLLVTNHHVAYRCLARLSATATHRGILERGYLAKTRSEEISCPGYDLNIVDHVEDVTAKILDGLPVGTTRNYHARYEKLRARKNALRKACEAKGKALGLSCKVVANNAGVSYVLTAYRPIRDVRLVFAPPKALGKFGGDIDNWMYPRHSADFAYLRAYVGPKGEGRAFSKDNVPLKTPIFLEQGRWGIKRGSLVLVLGFPGHTSRHVTSHAVRFYRDHTLSGMRELLAGAAKTLASRRQSDEVAKRKYAGVDAGFQNALKYYKMSEKGFARWKVLSKREAKEAALLAKLPATSRREAQKLLREMGTLYAHLSKTYGRYAPLSVMARWALRSLRAPVDIARWAVEKEKPEAKRKDSRYLDKNIYRIREGLARLDDEVDAKTEQALLRYFLGILTKLPRHQRSSSVTHLVAWGTRQERLLRRQATREKVTFEVLFRHRTGQAPAKDALTRTVQLLYGTTALLAYDRPGSDAKDQAQEKARAKAERARLFALKKKALAREKDPLVRFGRDIEAELRKLREGPLRIVEEYLGPVLRRRWISRYLKPRYDDANFTVRLSYGSVRDYHETATGKTHRYITDLPGVLAKDKGHFPFLVPAWLKAAAHPVGQSPDAKRARQARARYRDPQIKAIPVNFTDTLDTTGGNSGSAVLDDHGRLVGLLFDGTPESILSDWQYLGAEQRSICLDIRYAHYLATLRGATALLRELGLAK